MAVVVLVLVIFGGGNVRGSFMLGDVAWSNESILDLSSLRVGTLTDTGKCWPKAGHLLLNNFVYGEFNASSPSDALTRIKWLHLQPTNLFLSQPYEQLAGVLRKMGREDDAVDVLIAKNDDRAQRMKGVERTWWWFKGKIVGYGYKPMWGFYWSMLCIAFGTIVFWLAYRCNIICPTDKEKAHLHASPKLADDYPPFNPLIFSVENFIPLLLRLEIRKDWALNQESKKVFWNKIFSLRTAFRCYYFFHIVFGWLLTSLWVGALTGLVKS